MSFVEAKRWSDRFLPEIKSILGQVIIGEPPVVEDQLRNTDLIVLKMEAVRIACRIRKFKYKMDYGHQFTIRSRLKSRNETELHKVVSGWGSYIFYGFADTEENFLSSWFIGDLNVFRLWHSRQLMVGNGKEPGEARWNADGETMLTAYNIAELPVEFVVADSAEKRVRSFASVA